MTIATDANDKAAWVDNDLDEALFLDLYGKRLGLMLNPAKMESAGRYKADLLNCRQEGYADLKAQSRMFDRAQELFGIPPQRCVTLNVVDLPRYLVHYGPRFQIYFWVRFGGDTDGVYVATVQELVLAITVRKRRIHGYQTRDGMDGNKTHSYVLSLDDLTRVAE